MIDVNLEKLTNEDLLEIYFEIENYIKKLDNDLENASKDGVKK